MKAMTVKTTYKTAFSKGVFVFLHGLIPPSHLINGTVLQQQQVRSAAEWLSVHLL